jgi:signal transduction histidine kinase
LGLTLVKALIDLHQGWVRLDSTPGLGTQVRVWLPPARVRLQG